MKKRPLSFYFAVVCHLCCEHTADADTAAVFVKIIHYLVESEESFMANQKDVMTFPYSFFAVFTHNYSEHIS